MSETSAVDTSEAAVASANAPRVSPRFHYPISHEHTGRLQMCVDRADVMKTERLGEIKRGEVIAVKSETYARGMTAGGWFAFAPEDAPIGQPEAYAPKKPANPGSAFLAEVVNRAIGDVPPAPISADTIAAVTGTRPDNPEPGELIGGPEPPTGDETPLSVAFDFNAEPPSANFRTGTDVPLDLSSVAGGTATNPVLTAPDSATATTTKKSPK